MEKVSVIIPVYNSEKTLKRCLDSIIKQKYKILEIIVINDGSVDKSKEICDYYCAIDKRVSVIHKDNSGPALSRNVGLEIAAGKYITFVDSDDWIDDDYIFELVNLIESDKSDIVVCGWDMNRDYKSWPYKNNLKTDKCCSICDFLFLVFSDMDLGYINICCNKLIKRELITADYQKFINVDYIEDALFNYQLLSKVNKVTITTKVFYHNDVSNENSVSRKKRLVYDTLYASDRRCFEVLKMCNLVGFNPKYSTLIFEFLLYDMKSNILKIGEIGSNNRDLIRSRNLINESQIFSNISAKCKGSRICDKILCFAVKNKNFLLLYTLAKIRVWFWIIKDKY